MCLHVLFVGGVDFDLRIPFITAMRDRGFRVSVASSGDPAPFRSIGVHFVPFPFDRYMTPLSDIRAIRRLRKILEELRPDIAQGFDTKPCLMLPLAAGHGPVRAVRTICGRAWVYSSRSPIALAARPAYRMLHRLASTRTAATVFEIDSDRDFFVQARMAGQNGLVIPAGGGGIDVDGFERSLAEAKSPEALKKELDLTGAEIVITVTRVTRQKGIGTLLKAARAVHQQRPSVRFLLVGPRESEGPLAISKAELDQHRPYVIAIGPRTDIPALLRMADLFAFPTEYSEGVPRVLLEAGLANLPVVATAMPGCESVIRHRWNGRIVPPRAPGQLAQAILDTLADQQAAQVMAERSPKLIRERFSIAAISESHAQLYRLLESEIRTPSPSVKETGVHSVGTA